MQDIWKDVKGFEGRYQVSNTGKVKSLVRKIPILLKQKTDKRGYKRVSLGEKHTKLVHRLVAESFIDNPFNLPEVNHKDEQPCNNNVENLEWCTHRYNITYGTCQQRARLTQSIKHPQRNHIKTSKPVYCIELNRLFPSVHEAARELRLDRCLISKVCRGLRITTGGLTFIWGETH